LGWEGGRGRRNLFRNEHPLVRKNDLTLLKRMAGSKDEIQS
jgi:hypothetical protein